MSYAQLLSAIEEPALAEVAAHWSAARRQRRMPGWSDIDPAAVRRHLPIIWSWRFDFAQNTFIGRLAGEDIIAVLGTPIRGKRLGECFRADAVDVVHQRYKAVLDGPLFMHSSGKIRRPSGGTGLGERIVLPLAADGAHADGVLGATVYRLRVRPSVLDEIAIDHHNERLDFFSVDER